MGKSPPGQSRKVPFAGSPECLLQKEVHVAEIMLNRGKLSQPWSHKAAGKKDQDASSERQRQSHRSTQRRNVPGL